MGSVLLPTPLSPACGLPKGSTLRLTCLLRTRRSSADMSPGARAGAGSVPGQCGGPEDRSSTGLAACPQPGLLLWRLKRLGLAASCALHHRRRESGFRPTDDRSVAVSTVREFVARRHPLSLSYAAIMLSSRRVRSGFHLLCLRQARQERRSVFALDELRMRRAGRVGQARRASTYPLCDEMPVDKGG